MGRLTAISVRNATQPGRYADGDGLFLFVRPGGSRQWMLRLQVDNKRRDFGLGSAKDVTLAQAREKANALRADFKAGIDPVAKMQAERRARLTIPTFEGAAKDCHADMVKGWRNAKHRSDWISSLDRFAFAAIGSTRIDQIDTPAIRDVLLPIWIDRPETARRVRQRIKAVIDWAAGKGFRDTLDLSGLAKSLPRQPKTDNHFAAMAYADVPDFVAKVRDKPESVGRLALLFTILTAARSGEVRGATWPEIDFEAAEWRIPGERMKAGKPHVVPLSGPAIAILRTVEGLRTRIDGFVFPGARGRPMSDMTLTKAMRDMGETVTVHGFRSAFKDWASEATSFPDAVSEAALAHLDANKVRAAYRRTDFLQLRRDLMAAWAGYLEGPQDNVIPISGRITA